MGTRTTTKSPTNNTDANFRAWVAEVIAAFVAMGWVNTAATGTINTSTVTRPTVTGSNKGFVVLSMNDSLQSSSPIFVKIEFGSSGSDATDPWMQFTIGTGHDGAGGLTGNVTSPFSINLGQAGSSTLYDCYSSGSSSRMALVMFGNFTYPLCFVIERIKADDGTDSDKGVYFAAFVAGQSVNWSGCVFKSGTGSYYLDGHTGGTHIQLPIPYNGGGADGADLAIYSPKFYKGSELNTPTILAGYISGDITGYTTITVTMYGTTRTMKAINAMFYTNVRTGQAFPLFRWD